MKKRILTLALALALLSATAVALPTKAKETPEIDIMWLSTSGRPYHYVRKEHALGFVENSWGGTVTYIDLVSGEEIPPPSRASDQVPISFSCTQRIYTYGSDGTLMGVRVCNEAQQWGFLNANGEIIIPCEYEGIVPSSDAEVFAVSRGEEYGFVNTNNELIIPFEWARASGFSEDYAAVARTDESGNLKWGYIDLSGSIFIPLEYDFVSSFHNGFAAVGRNDELGNTKWGYIDRSGHVIIPLKYDSCERFENGLAAVGQNDKMGNMKRGCIDTSGNVIIPLEYSYVDNQGSLIVAEKNGDYGCFNTSGEIILSLEYDNMDSIGDGMYMVQKGASYGIFESPYWLDLEQAPSTGVEKESVQSQSSLLGIVVAVFASVAGIIGLLVFTKHRKSKD